jgi:hypothetical protein
VSENIRMVVIAFGIAAAQALILFGIERLAHWLRERKRVQDAPEARFIETPYTALSLQEMQMLLVAACEDAVRRLREDGRGVVRVNVLGWSWGVSPLQMSTFLAWARGRTVTWDGCTWQASVEPRPDEKTAWIVFVRLSRSQAALAAEREEIERRLLGKGTRALVDLMQREKAEGRVGRS